MKQLPAITQTLALTSFSILSLFTIAPAQAASFAGIPGLFSSLSGVSADGSVIVGQIYGGPIYRPPFPIDRPPQPRYISQAARWTQSGGSFRLDSFVDTFFPETETKANGVSADGSVIVGNSISSRYGAGPFRWTESSGMVALDFDPTPYANYTANGVSADGSVIVGSRRGTAFRWTQSNGIVDLVNLSGGSYGSNANGVSADGSVIVGYSGDTAFRWTQETGMVSLGALSGSSYSSNANGVSADGSVIIGSSNGQAFRWTQETGMVGLGSNSSASGVSADGSVIVGTSANRAFRWTQETGMVSLKETLIGEGLDVSGWTLFSPNAISADGFTIVGHGINPSGQGEAWVANLEPIPEPLTILGSIAAIAFAAGFERKFSKNKSEEKDPDD
jgi:probable HAF family extracellular repeat protein